MCKGPVLAAVAVVCLVLLCLPGAGPAADEPAPAVPADADFGGKVLAINTTAGDKAWSILEKVQLRKVGNRSFLVGKGVDDGREPNPYKGRTLWIAVDHVVQMVEFASVAELKKSYEQGGP